MRRHEAQERERQQNREKEKEEETEEKPTFSVAGSIDTYFRSADYAPGTSFANKPGFALGMANVILSYEGEKSGFVADFVYGPRGVEAVLQRMQDEIRRDMILLGCKSIKDLQKTNVIFRK